ncbi:hypothetical protein [Bacillus cabrialesii]|uniref:hypothetical protein n=1 Tax=Bacillus cabrialesii TaxID=2487276 RepID=UPI0028F7E453|nr:hypothetical protein [Bacillus cabrialesii]MDU0154039.1 hypothetical protein [Bacillus cabrialesii]
MRIRKILEDLRKTDEKEKIGHVDPGLVLNLEIANHEKTCIENKVEAFMRYLIAKGIEPKDAVEEKYQAEWDKRCEAVDTAWKDIYKSAGLSEKEIEQYEYTVSTTGCLYRGNPRNVEVVFTASVKAGIRQ